MLKFLTFFYLLLGDNVWARSIKATADRLGSEAKTIGLSISIIGLAVAGIMRAMGKQDAGAKITQALLGCLVIVMSSNIAGFIKGVA